MRLQDIMTRDIQWIAPDTSLHEAAQLMQSRDVGFLPIGDANNPVGVVTDRDIVIRGIAEELDPASARVQDIMSTDLLTLPEDHPVEEAARLMEDRQIRRLLVEDADHRIRGILSLGDLAFRTHDQRLSGEALERVSAHA